MNIEQKNNKRAEIDLGDVAVTIQAIDKKSFLIYAPSGKIMIRVVNGNMIAVEIEEK